MREERVFLVFPVVVRLPSKHVFRTGDILMRRAFVRADAPSTIVRRVVGAAALGVSLEFFTRPSSKWAEQTMKFESISGKQRSRRSKSSRQAPGVVESLEVRSLMTAAPVMVSLPAIVIDATPTFAWSPIENATSYDLWVSDAEQRTVEFIENGITATDYTPTAELNLGRTRAWVRANFANAVPSAWSTPIEFVVKVAPVLTGPVNSWRPETPNKLETTKPTITWTSPPGAFKFEIFFSDQTSRTSKTISVKNLIPALDADGNTQPDGKGDVLRQEVRSYTIPDDLIMGNYRVFMRSFDDGGRISAWSAAFNFEVAPPVILTRPKGVTFDNPPLLEWELVPGATDYDVTLAKASSPSTYLFNLQKRIGTSYQVPKALESGDYVFMVRAHRRVAGRVETVGLWSLPGNFSTISKPIITGPVGVEIGDQTTRIVTAARPVVEWTLIDRAARYEIWVEIRNGKTPFLKTTSSTPSYQFEQDLKAETYTVWVRAVSTRGVLTEWSAAYTFEATGGRPIITSPVADTIASPLLIITWTPIVEAKSYNVWITQTGANGAYINATGIDTPVFSPTDPLPTGTYRVWVQAVKADGTVLPWSKPVTFFVASLDVAQPAGEVPELLAALLPTTGDVQVESITEVATRKSIDEDAANVPAENARIPVELIAMRSTHPVMAAMTPETEDIIQQLAEECMSTEWWMPQGTES